MYMNEQILMVKMKGDWEEVYFGNYYLLDCIL